MTFDELNSCLLRTGVAINWQQAAAQWHISFASINSLAVLKAAYLPRYFDSSNWPVPYNHPNARPITVDEAARTISSWPGADQQMVVHYAAIYKLSKLPIRIILPAFELPNQEKLLLDGVHRSIALVHGGISSFQIELVLFAGPRVASILPDLKHWP